MDLLLAFQRWINTAITADLSAFAVTRTWAGLIAVLPLGIVFGAAHALTPGHARQCSPPIWRVPVWPSYAAFQWLACCRSRTSAPPSCWLSPPLLWFKRPWAEPGVRPC